MTDKEKIMRHDALETLRQRIGNCFGSVDGLFAEHPDDMLKARELRQIAYKNKITLQEIIEMTFGFLYGCNYPDNHIKEQLIKVKEMFQKKIQ